MPERKSAKSYSKTVVRKKLLKSKLMKPKLSREELYKALSLDPERELAATDPIKLVELLISLTEDRGIRFRVISRDEIYFKIVYQLKEKGTVGKFKKTDSWQIRLKKSTKPRRFLGKLLGRRDAYYSLWIRNKLNPYPESIGIWEVRESAKEQLSLRLGKLLEAAFHNLYRM
jgi:hypothetical protein